jgi:hypothetical protein
VTRPGPNFEELVGSDLDAAERDRLRRVHDLLVAAGPPPEMSALSAPAVEEAPAPQPRGRRRRGALIAFATTLGLVAAFAIGVGVAGLDDPSVDRVVALSGPTGASARIEVYELDDGGNWPMRIEVQGLAPAEEGRLFQLWLTKGGKPAALCGSFFTDVDGDAVVPMNAPWRLSDFDGWIVVEEGSQTPLLTT